MKIKKNFKRAEPSNNGKDLDSITNLIANIDVKEKLHPFKIDVSDKNIKLKIEPKLSEETINDLKPEPILLKKFINKEDIIINTKNIIDNTGGGDCWFKTISLALYKDEEYHLTIRKKIYESLVSKKSYFEENGLTINTNNQIIQISDYIEQIKFANQWSGDVEISETYEIYNINIVIYKVNKIQKNKSNLSFYNIFGDLNVKNKPLIFVVYNDHNHYRLIDYNNNLLSFDYGITVESQIATKNEENKVSDSNYNLYRYFKKTLKLKTKNDYPYYPGYSNGDYFYKEVIEYIKSTITNFKNNKQNSQKSWPKFIEDIKDIKIRENKKRMFRMKASKYIYYNNNLYVNKSIDHDEINNRIFSSIIKENDNEIIDIIKNNNNIYRVPTLFECIELIKKFHSDTNHRSSDALKEKFKEEKISWKGISNDINYFIQHCATCQFKNRAIIKKPFVKQILFDKPRQRYILDLSELPSLIKENTEFKYFMHVIDHYSNFLFGMLLKDKKGDTILINLEHLFLTTGFPTNML